MKNLKQIVLVLLLFIIMLAIIIVISIKAKDKEELIKQNNNEYISNSTEYGDGKDEEKESGNIDWKKGYYAITRILNVFSDTLKRNDEEEIIRLIDKQYLKENNIDEDNIQKITRKYTTDRAIMYSGTYEKISDNITLYNVKSNIGNLYIKVEMVNNTINGKFAIMPEKLKDETKIKEGIEENESNKVSFDGGTDDEIAVNLYLRFIYSYVNDINEAYELLDDNYKKERFTTLNEFTTYMKSIKIDLGVNTNYIYNRNFYMTEYIIKDSLDNVFVFYYDNNIDYTVALDSYTEITNMERERYRRLNDEDKAKQNLGYYIQAFNTFDYQTAYSKLMEETKREFYPTQESFNQFINQNLFDHNVLNILELSDNNANMYQFNIELKNQQNLKEKVKLNIIVKLIENDDYEIAFSLDNN